MSVLNKQVGLEESLLYLSLRNRGSTPSHDHNFTADEKKVTTEISSLNRKVGPSVPPKPFKKHLVPEIPQSSHVKQKCKPLYSQRLQFSDSNNVEQKGSSFGDSDHTLINGPPLLHRKKPTYATQTSYDVSMSKVTLDNPAVLQQQLEVLAHHKKQLEKKGFLQKSSSNAPKLSSVSLASGGAPDTVYANIQTTQTQKKDDGNSQSIREKDNMYSNVNAQRRYFETILKTQNAGMNPVNYKNRLYSNVMFEKNGTSSCPQAPLNIATMSSESLHVCEDDTNEPPSSPVSSSYSELRRATDDFSTKHIGNCLQESKTLDSTKAVCSIPDTSSQTYMNMKYNNEFPNYSHTSQNNGQDSTDYYGFGSFSQSSSTYESIYEPINPRPPSQLSVRSNYLCYSPYTSNASHTKSPEIGSGSILSTSSSLNLSTLGGMGTSHEDISLYSSAGGNNSDNLLCISKPESEVEGLSGFILHSIDETNDVDNYGTCFKCNGRVLCENSGCTAMNQIYHITCFTCSQCQINLQGKPFFALEGQPYCEYDYLQTLEKCSVCMKPILERILRATGKPYHPQCFTCVMCGKSLDGIQFTVDATNQNYCIEDFHKKFAPRCCVCKEPIMPEPGEEETVRVVALDRSFHFECYKCEDCGLLLSSEAEGRGCYPLDDHVLCKSCNAKRVQLLTNRITTEL